MNYKYLKRLYILSELGTELSDEQYNIVEKIKKTKRVLDLCHKDERSNGYIYFFDEENLYVEYYNIYEEVRISDDLKDFKDSILFVLKHFYNLKCDYYQFVYQSPKEFYSTSNIKLYSKYI